MIKDQNNRSVVGLDTYIAKPAMSNKCLQQKPQSPIVFFKISIVLVIFLLLSLKIKLGIEHILARMPPCFYSHLICLKMKAVNAAP